MLQRVPPSGPIETRVPFTLAFVRNQDSGASQSQHHLLWQVRFMTDTPGNYDFAASGREFPPLENGALAGNYRGNFLSEMPPQAPREMHINAVRWVATDVRGNTFMPMPPNIQMRFHVWSTVNHGTFVGGSTGLFASFLNTGDNDPFFFGGGIFCRFDQPLIVPADRYLLLTQRIIGTRPNTIFTSAQVFGHFQ